LGNINFTAQSASGISAYEAFRAEAAAAQVGDYPAILELGGGGVFALRVNEVIAPMVPALDDIKDIVTKDWRAQQVTQALMESARAIESDIASGANIEELGLETARHEALTRRDFLPDLPPSFMEDVFAPGVAEGGTTLVQGDGVVIIAKIDRVAINVEDPDVVRVGEELAAQAAQSAAQDAIDAFTTAVRTREGISINQAVINAVHANMQ